MTRSRFGDFSAWRHGGGSDWPPAWPSYSVRWPKPPTIWVPERPGGITVCVGPPEPLETVVWSDATEALLAAALLFGESCSPLCTRHHFVVWTDEHGVHVRGVVGDPPPLPDDLGAALAACYPSRNGHTTIDTSPALWPKPSNLNLPRYRKEPYDAG